MGSFKANGGEQGPNRRRKTTNAIRRGIPKVLESLEDRTLLSAFLGLVPEQRESRRRPERPDGEPRAGPGRRLPVVPQGRDVTATQLSRNIPLLRFQNNSVEVGLTADPSADFQTFRDRPDEPGHAGGRFQRRPTRWSTAGCRSVSSPRPRSSRRP